LQTYGDFPTRSTGTGLSRSSSVGVRSVCSQGPIVRCNSLGWHSVVLFQSRGKGSRSEASIRIVIIFYTVGCICQALKRWGTVGSRILGASWSLALPYRVPVLLTLIYNIYLLLTELLKQRTNWSAKSRLLAIIILQDKKSSVI
jgi:hypothetical protein